MHSYYAGVSPKKRLFPRKGPSPLEKKTIKDITFALSWGGGIMFFSNVFFTQLEGGINFNGKKCPASQK